MPVVEQSKSNEVNARTGALLPAHHLAAARVAAQSGGDGGVDVLLAQFSEFLMESPEGRMPTYQAALQGAVELVIARSAGDTFYMRADTVVSQARQQAQWALAPLQAPGLADLRANRIDSGVTNLGQPAHPVFPAAR